MDKTLSDALQMLTKVNSKLVDRVVNIEKKIGKDSGVDAKATSKPEKLYKTSNCQLELSELPPNTFRMALKYPTSVHNTRLTSYHDSR